MWKRKVFLPFWTMTKRTFTKKKFERFENGCRLHLSTLNTFMHEHTDTKRVSLILTPVWLSLRRLLTSIWLSLRRLLTTICQPFQRREHFAYLLGCYGLFAIILDTQFLLSLRDQEKTVGTDVEDGNWSYGQILAIFVWVPVFVEYVYVFMFESRPRDGEQKAAPLDRELELESPGRNLQVPTDYTRLPETGDDVSIPLVVHERG